MSNFDRFKKLGVDDEVELSMDFLKASPQPFREHPSDNSIILMGAQTLSAYPMRPRAPNQNF